MKYKVKENWLGDVRYSRVQSRVVALAFLCAMLDGLDLQIIAYVVPTIAEALSLSVEHVGLIFSAGFIGLAVGSMFIAPLGDRWGRKIVIILSLMLFGGSMLITPFARSVEGLVVLRLLTGCGIGGIMPNVIAITIEYAPKAHRSAMSTFVYMGFIIGAAIGGFVASLIMQRFGWEGVFFLGGTLPLALAVVLIWILPESLAYLLQQKDAARRIKRIGDRFQIDVTTIIERPQNGRSPGGVGIKALFASGYLKNTILVWIAMFSALLSLFPLVQWLPSLLHKAQMPLADANFLVGAMWLAAIIGAVIYTYGSRYVLLNKILSIYLLLAFFFTACAGVIAQEDVLSVWPFVIGIGITGAACQVGFYSVLSNIYPASIRVTGIGMAQGIGRTAAIVGPAIVARLLDMEVPLVYVYFWLAVPFLFSAMAMCYVGGPRRSNGVSSPSEETV